MEYKNLNPLNKITKIIKRGITPKYTANKRINVINQRCIRDGRIDFSPVRFHDDSKKIQEDKILKNYDVLVNSTGVGTLGRVAQFKNISDKIYTVDSHVTILRPIDEIDKIYFGYAIKNKEPFITKMGEGSTGQTELSRDRLGEEVIINVPTLEIQKSIASIMYSLDKKIEVNEKTIANLEEQAQAIFKSWFIDFEPFQDGNFVESELGMIPEGWEVGKLGKSKLGKIIGSGIEKFNDEKIYLATADVSDTDIINTSTIIYFNERPSRANMQPKPKTIWFAKMKDSRKLILVDDIDNEILENMIFSTGFAGIECNESSLYYLWTYIITEEFDKIKNSYCEGTTMQAINNKNINKILIIVPKDDVLDNYRKIVGPLFKNISRLKVQNKKLAEIRDAILPRLMAGEIDVSSIKIKGEEVKNE